MKKTNKQKMKRPFFKTIFSYRLVFIRTNKIITFFIVLKSKSETNYGSFCLFLLLMLKNNTPPPSPEKLLFNINLLFSILILLSYILSYLISYILSYYIILLKFQDAYFSLENIFDVIFNIYFNLNNFHA